MTIPSDIKKQIAKYNPVNVDGLTLYPITVEYYEYFSMARPAIEFLQQSLPVRLMSIPLLSAFWKLDYEANINGTTVTGLFYRSMMFLALALRLIEPDDETNLFEVFRLSVDPNDPSKFLKLDYRDAKSGQVISITPVVFQSIRPILAAQNGIELLPDTVNPELVEAEQEIANQRSLKLDSDIESVINTIATLSGVDNAEIYSWSIKKLYDRMNVYQRLINYAICGIGEAQGTQWKGGNPYPSLWYERTKSGDSSSLMALNEFAGGAGAKAFAEAGGSADVKTN